MATKASPPIAVAAANTFSDLTVPDIVNYLTLVYLVLMISHKAWSMWREYKATGNAAWVPRSKERRGTRERSPASKEAPE